MSGKLVNTTILGLIICLSITAETVVLQNGTSGYTGCADTYLIMNSAAAQGAKDRLEIEGYHCAACIDERLLIKFDLSALPKTTPVTKATLSLYSTAQPRPGSATVNIYTIPKAWDEATANWTKASAAVSWSKAGGDYSATAVGTYTYGLDINVWHDIDVTAAVAQFMKNPDANFGLHLYMEPAMFTVRYTSSNSTDQIHKPKLTIETATASVRAGIQTSRVQPISIRQSSRGVVVLSSDMDIRQATVFTLDGRDVDRAAGHTNRMVLDISAVPAGTYLVAIRGEENDFIRKITVR